MRNEISERNTARFESIVVEIVNKMAQVQIDYPGAYILTTPDGSIHVRNNPVVSDIQFKSLAKLKRSITPYPSMEKLYTDARNDTELLRRAALTSREGSRVRLYEILPVKMVRDKERPDCIAELDGVFRRFHEVMIDISAEVDGAYLFYDHRGKFEVRVSQDAKPWSPVEKADPSDKSTLSETLKKIKKDPVLKSVSAPVALRVQVLRVKLPGIFTGLKGALFG